MNQHKQSVDTTPNPRVEVEVDGNLWIKGWTKPEVLASCETPEDLSLEQRDGEVRVDCRNHCTLHVPLAAELQVNSVQGEAVFRSLEGQLHVHLVSGNLILRNVSTTYVENIEGNLTAQSITGNLHIKSIEGNATVRDVQGDFTVEDSIQGNLTLSDVDGNVSARVDGNLSLRIDPQPGNTYSLHAEGNLTCHLPPDASAIIEIRQARRLQVNLPTVAALASAQAPYTITLGDGDSTIILSAEGNVLLNSEVAGWGARDTNVEFNLSGDIEHAATMIGEQVTRQIEAQMEQLEQQLEAQLENLTQIGRQSGLPEEQVERIAERARAASERASARARAKIQRVEEKLRRKLEHARQQAERAARDRRRRVIHPTWVAWMEETPPTEPEREPVTDEERLMILKMVEERKITIEEAEQLLKALEGEGTRGET